MKWRVKPLRAGTTGCREIQANVSFPGQRASYKTIAYTVGLHNDNEDAANACLLAGALRLREVLAEMVDAIHNPDRMSGFLLSKAEAVLGEVKG